MGKNSRYMGSVGVILTALCLLTSCRGEIPPTEEPAWETGQEQVGDADQSLVLVRGYGAVRAEGETVLVPEKLPESLETEGARAWLCGAFVQDGRLGFRVLVEDDSLRETEGGDGETAAGGYDSLYQEQRERWQEEHPDWEGFYRVEEDRTYTPGSMTVGRFTDGEEGNVRGILTLQAVCEIGSGASGDGFSGEIRVNGFETGFSVRFVPAWESLEMTEGDRAFFAAEGGVEDGQLTAAVYTIPREGEAAVSRLTALAEGEAAGEMTALWRPSGDRGCPQGLEGNVSIWRGRLADGAETSGKAAADEREISLKAEQVWVYLDEETEPVVIPVPEETAEMNETVELENGTIAFGTVERTENGEESSLLVEVDVTQADDDFSLVSFYGIIPGTVWEGADSYGREGLCLVPDQENGWQEAPERMRAVYEEGEQEVTAELTGFTYLWNCGEEIPVKEMPQHVSGG